MEAFSERCVCGRTFSQPYALTNHQRTCKKRKSRLSSALAKAKDFWINRKRPRLNAPEAGLTLVAPAQSLTVDEPPNDEVKDIPICHYSYSFLVFV
jgi:hypothetical protein